VTASNSVGIATAGLFTVTAIAQANMAITLTCLHSAEVRALRDLHREADEQRARLRHRRADRRDPANRPLRDVMQRRMRRKRELRRLGAGVHPRKSTLSYTVTLNASSAGGESTSTAAIRRTGQHVIEVTDRF
jgi:hypothetical protein